MAHVVKTLVAGLELPDGNLYPAANTTVTLTDAQYAMLDANIFTNDLQDLGVAFVAVTVTASPFTYTATAPGTMLINPGAATVSALSWNSNAVPATAAIIPLQTNDTLTITYSGGTPTMRFRSSS